MLKDQFRKNFNKNITNSNILQFDQSHKNFHQHFFEQVMLR